MKKLLTILIVLTMTIGIVGCSSKDDVTQNNSEVSTTDTTDADTTQDTVDTEDTESIVDTEISVAVNDEIMSTGPNGDTAVNAFTLSLTDEEKELIKNGNYTAAISFHYGGNDWSAAQLKALEDTFANLGIEVIGVTDADFAPEQQVTDLETLMALEPDIIVSIPTDPVATADAFQRAADAGIKLVFMDNIPAGFEAGDNYVSCVSADNYGNGIIAANLIGEALNGEGKIGIVYFDVDFFVTNQRLEAFEKTMADLYPNIEVVSKMGFTDPNQGSVLGDAMITQFPDIDAIFVHWDVPAEGVLSSLRAAGINDVFISTIDLGNNIALEIAEGNVLGVGAQLPYDQGVAEATLAAYALLGKEAPAYVAVPAMRVDQSNIIDAYETVYKIAAPNWLLEAVQE